MNILEIKKLNYKNIFKDLNFDIIENSTNYISGSNKCGKTTLIKILSGLISVESSIFYKNKDINKLHSYEISTLFGCLFLSDTIDFNFSTINQELLYRLDKINIEEQEKKKRYNRLIKIFGLEDYLYNNINELSLDKKIKTLLIKQLLSKPKILLLDDILLNLDHKEAASIINKLKEEHITIIYSSSTLDLSIEFDNIYILNKGTLLLKGKTKDVLKEDSLLNKIGLELPFMADLSIKLQYYDLLDDIEFNMDGMVNKLWK